MDRSDKYFDLYKKLYDLKGQRIRFNTTLGLYEGYIDYLLPRNRLVSFRNVYALPDKEFAGNLRFLLEDFISFKPVEPEEYEKYEKWDYVTRILDNADFGPTKYKITDVFDDLESVLSENEQEVEECEEDFILELPPDFERKLPTESVIIDKIDSNFQAALFSISQEAVIGVSFEGPRILRTGELSWILISIPQCTYLFDIHVLGDSAFNEGLKDIIQDKQIQKVVHDCRKPADCLYHLFGTKIKNVFDTQVADYIVNTQRCKGKSPFKYISSLDCCLVNHLDVPKEFLINRKENYSYQAELNFYHVRPVTNEYRAVMIKNVIYLRLLKEKLTELMLSPFYNVVDIHLGVLADSTGPQHLLEPHNPEEISPAVLMHGILTVKYKENVEIPPFPLAIDYKDSQNKTVIIKSNESAKKVSFSVDKNLDKKINKSADKNVEGKTEAASIMNKDLQKVHKNSTENCNHNVEESFIINYKSRRHIDDVYHKLVNSLHRPEVVRNSMNVKPEIGVSKIVIKKPFVNTAPQERLENEQSVDCNNDYKSDHQDSDCVISEIASGIKTRFNSPNNVMWSKFPETSGNTLNEPENSTIANKVCFVPAGMGC